MDEPLSDDGKTRQQESEDSMIALSYILLAAIAGGALLLAVLIARFAP